MKQTTLQRTALKRTAPKTIVLNGQKTNSVKLLLLVFVGMLMLFASMHLVAADLPPPPPPPPTGNDTGLPPPPPPPPPVDGGNTTNSTAGVVTLLAPGSTTSSPFNVTYTHTFSGAVTCTVSVDAVLRTFTSVAANVQNNVFFSVDAGSHFIAVNCTNGTASAGDSRSVSVSTTPPSSTSLSVSPAIVSPGSTVTISGSFNPLDDIHLVIRNANGVVDQPTLHVGTGGTLSYQYQVPIDALAGNYVVTGTSVGTGAMKSGSFTVQRPSPVLHYSRISGGVVISAEQFVTNDNTSLTLTGATTIVNYVMTDASGSFTFTYRSLDDGAYSLVAKSVATPSVQATLGFTLGTNQSNNGGSGVLGGIGSNTNSDTGSTTGQGSTPANAGSIAPTTEQASAVDTTVNTNSGYGQDTSTTTPNVTKDATSDTSSSSRWWIFLIVGIVIIGGLTGYLVYNGTLDISSMSAFSESVSALFSGSFGSAVPHTHAASAAEKAQVRSFISSERARGFDDLTIRNALIGKGWNKQEVDSTFDDIYRDQQHA